jgi:hypothetical protein
MGSLAILYVSFQTIDFSRIPRYSCTMLSIDASTQMFNPISYEWQEQIIKSILSPSDNILHFTYQHLNVISAHKIDTIHRNKSLLAWS